MSQPLRVDDRKLERVIQDLARRVTTLERKLGAQVGSPKQTEGVPGAVRSVKRADGNTVFQIKTKDGWFETTTLPFQEKEVTHGG